MLSQLLQDGKIRNVVSLDQISMLSAAKESPHEFIEALMKPVGIDEIQRAPELILALKKYVDENKNSGDFLITGSSNIYSYPETLDSLCGRLRPIRLRGLSIAEKTQQTGDKNIIEHVFENFDISLLSLQDKLPDFYGEAVWKSVFFGSFPDPFLCGDEIFKSSWCESYVTTYIERDLRGLANDMTSFHKFFQYVALMSSQQFVTNSCAAALQIDHRQLQKFLGLLENGYQVQQIAPFFSNKIKKLIKSPKVYLSDSGLTSWFFKMKSSQALQESPHKGALLETFVCNELASLCDEEYFHELSYLRTPDGIEVDFIVSNGEKHIAIECKSSLPSSKDALKGLLYFVGLEPFSQGWVLYPGNVILQLAPKIYAVPIAMLGVRIVWINSGLENSEQKPW